MLLLMPSRYAFRSGTPRWLYSLLIAQKSVGGCRGLSGCGSRCMCAGAVYDGRVDGPLIACVLVRSLGAGVPGDLLVATLRHPVPPAPEAALPWLHSIRDGGLRGLDGRRIQVRRCPASIEFSSSFPRNRVSKYRDGVVRNVTRRPSFLCTTRSSCPEALLDVACRRHRHHRRRRGRCGKCRGARGPSTRSDAREVCGGGELHERPARAERES